MKLLSQAQLQQLKDAEIRKELIRSQEMDKQTKKSREDIAKAQTDFFDTLAKNRETWAKEEQSHLLMVKEMSDEIKKLEKRKGLTLVPIKIEQDRIDMQLKFIEKTRKELEKEKENLSILQDLLEDKLDAVGECEQDVALKEQKATAKALQIETRSSDVEAKIKALNAQIIEFMRNKELADNDLQQRWIAVKLREMAMEARKESLDRTEKALEQIRIKLNDERAVLDRAIKRISP